MLIGFMGTGKSSVGRRLEQAIGCRRFDIDQMITKSLGMPIEQIFSALGEARFRAEESVALQSLNPETRAIIVTGGGIVLRPENAARLRELGTVVCLTADLPTLLARLARRSDRPLLRTENRAETVQALLREREPFYREAADLTIDTSSLSHDEVAQSIQDSLARAV